MDLTYWTCACRALIRHLRGTPGFARELATAGLRADLEPAAPVRHLFDAFPEAEDLPVEMGRVRYRRSNLDPQEQYALSAIAFLCQPRRIFELGTYDGATTLLLARQAPNAQIFTIDLPPEASENATVLEETRNAAQGVGARFGGQPEAGRITQLLGDTREFDFSPWYRSIDLVLVDAGHEYDAARADTATALQLVAPGGIVVWDDYVMGWPGVVRAVDESPASVFRLAGTDFAIATCPPL